MKLLSRGRAQRLLVREAGKGFGADGRLGVSPIPFPLGLATFLVHFVLRPFVAFSALWNILFRSSFFHFVSKLSHHGQMICMICMMCMICMICSHYSTTAVQFIIYVCQAGQIDRILICMICMICVICMICMI